MAEKKVFSTLYFTTWLTSLSIISRLIKLRLTFHFGSDFWDRMHFALNQSCNQTKVNMACRFDTQPKQRNYKIITINIHKNHFHSTLSTDTWSSNLSARRPNLDLSAPHDKQFLLCQSFPVCLLEPSWFCCCYPCLNQSWCVCCGRRTYRCTGRTTRTSC